MNWLIEKIGAKNDLKAAIDAAQGLTDADRAVCHAEVDKMQYGAARGSMTARGTLDGAVIKVAWSARLYR